jgi:hypothetical protein
MLVKRIAGDAVCKGTATNAVLTCLNACQQPPHLIRIADWPRIQLADAPGMQLLHNVPDACLHDYRTCNTSARQSQNTV